jgi:hypothetical protein
MNKKKVFFLANPYLDLYKSIVTELERQQYDVYVFLDRTFRCDPDFKNNRFRWLKKIIFITFNFRKQYWKKAVRQPCFNEKYDIFLCLQGYSVDKILIDRLRKNNTDIKSILYLWDSNSHYNFSKNFKFFDKIFTFDRIDALRYKVHHLPIYWVNEENRQQPEKTEYKVFFVGSLHSDRYWLLKNITQQLDAAKISHYIKLYVPPTNITAASMVRYLWYNISMQNRNIEEWKIIYRSKFNSSFLTNQAVGISEYNNMLRKSACILDTDQPCQNGLTARFIWALAANKKIITTSQDIINYSFYSPDRILLIDRKKPEIDCKFLSDSDEPLQFLNEIIKLRIDNWVKTLLH